MILGQWLMAAYKPQNFYKYERDMTNAQVAIRTFGFTKIDNIYYFNYIAYLKYEDAEFLPTNLMWGSHTIDIQNSNSHRLRTDSIDGAMMLQYFMEKGVDLSSWETIDTETQSVMLCSCALETHENFDPNNFVQNRALILTGAPHFRRFDLNFAIELLPVDLQSPVTIEIPSPYTQESLVVNISAIQFLDYWQQLDQELKDRNTLAGQSPALGIESLTPEHLESLKSVFKPNERMAYITYETSTNQQLKCRLIHKVQPQQNGMFFMSQKDKLGSHGQRIFFEFIGFVDSMVLDKKLEQHLITSLRETLPTLAIEGLWFKGPNEVKLEPVVYHGSSTLALTEIAPRVSTHGEAWVYGNYDANMSAALLSDIGSDFTCAVLRCPITGMVVVNERFAGAFDLRYDKKQGCLYTLDNANFISGQTEWPEEVVAEGPQAVLRYAEIDDIAHYLRQLDEQGHLIIIPYPQKHFSIPHDDSDLVEKAAVWSVSMGPWILEDIKRYQPQLLERVEAMIAARAMDEVRNGAITVRNGDAPCEEGSHLESDLERIRRLLFGD